jgi:uroporphyrinogen-III synthase
MRPLVIVRPEPAASATAAAAEALGLKPIVMPLFELEPVDWRAPDPDAFDALLLTSANALVFAGGELERFKPLPAYCIGEATAAAAREADLRIAEVGTGGVDSLLASLPAGLRLLHLCGADRREPIQAGHSITAIAIYSATAVEPPAEFRNLADAVIAVHSPRAGQRLAIHAKHKASLAIAAISVAAERAAGPGWKQVRSAAKPTDSALLALAAELCNKPD